MGELIYFCKRLSILIYFAKNENYKNGNYYLNQPQSVFTKIYTNILTTLLMGLMTMSSKTR